MIISRLTEHEFWRQGTARRREELFGFKLKPRQDRHRVWIPRDELDLEEYFDLSRTGHSAGPEIHAEMNKFFYASQRMKKARAS